MNGTKEQRGAAVLLDDSAQAETYPGPHCLACRHYRTAEHGDLVLCAKRTNTRTWRDDWTHKNFEVAARRAAKCHDFDDMRPPAEAES